MSAEIAGSNFGQSTYSRVQYVVLNGLDQMLVEAHIRRPPPILWLAVS